MTAAQTYPATGIPFLGCGFGYRPELARGALAAKAQVEVVEIITERYTGHPCQLAELEALCDQFRMVPHGVDLSIGSAAPLDRSHLGAIKKVSDLTRAPYYSEHLAVTRAPGLDLGHPGPLWFTEQILETTIQKVATVQEFLGKPLVLENVTYEFEIPGGMPQAEFFSRLVEATGCGVLLDVTSVWINSVNHQFDPIAFLEAMPLEHVVQVHLSGAGWCDGRLIDGHSAAVQEESWALLEALVERTRVKTVILEHDDHYPPIDELLGQVERARAMLAGGAAQ
jgi:uncharacterized protein (UPF0276 family)